MKTFRRMACVGLAAVMGLLLTSCDKYNYTDDLQGLGKRVEILEAMVLQANNDLEALNIIIATIQKNGYVTNIVEGEDGSYTITFNDGNVVTLRDGKDGEDGNSTLNISVTQDPSTGLWYWTKDGQWIVDGDGNRMQAGATDGKDGSNASVVIPQVRINPVTRYWEISTDGGNTWTSTYITAIGKDGEKGRDDIFKSVIFSEDGKYVTFVMRNGSGSYTVPIILIQKND